MRGSQVQLSNCAIFQRYIPITGNSQEIDQLSFCSDWYGIDIGHYAKAIGIG